MRWQWELPQTAVLPSTVNLTGKTIFTRITPRTIRERVMAYLSSLAKKSGSHIVTTNFDRQQLADFLCVDRSALSTELGKMHREGLIDLKGREFILPENCSRGT